MKFLKLKWKNLLSYGNKIQEYEFSHTPELVLIQGENGAGKSSIKEALTVSTYGKSAIRKIKDIPNWMNRAAYTYVEFESTIGDNIIIERGIDPNFSQIKINGVSHNLPDKRKIDDFIEGELLNLNFSIFCNTISLSFDDFKSFVNLSASDKRKIVDPMFGIDILTDMKSKIKEELKENKKSLDIIDNTLSKNNQLLESSINQLKTLRAKLNEAAENKESEIEDNLATKRDVLKEHKEKFNSIKKKIDAIQKKANDFNSKSIECSTKISQFDDKLKIFNNNKCPHCLSDLTGESSQSIKKSIEEKKMSEVELLDKLKSNKTKAFSLIEELTKDQELEKNAYYELSAAIKTLESELERAKDSSSTDQEDSIKEIIKNIKDEIKRSQDESKDYQDNVELYSTLDDIVSDNGIKRVLIDRVIPLLNNRIEEISERLEFKFNFSFDNEFNPNIQYMGLDISPDSLSTGQKKKMNLIVLLSFIELIKLKHNNMNVMFLDEIFSGLDRKNVYMAIEILREYADKYNMTIFVVSHESLPEEFFDKKINVTMPNQFSEMEIELNVKKEPALN
jgi:DNA repair exonuclease SbcCD ATPase subunit